MEDSKKYLIIYHKEDNDGLFSMAIAYNYIVHELKVPIDNIQLIGADYDTMNRIGKEPVDEEGTTKLDGLIESFDVIIMTDISFNDFSCIRKIYDRLKENFIWIDHHAPVIKQAAAEGLDIISGLRDSSRSAILNMYKFLYDVFDAEYSNKSLKIELFRILSAWDSFSFEREGFTKEYVMNVNTGINNEYMLDANRIIDLVYDILYPTMSDYPDINDEIYEECIMDMENEGAKYNKVQSAKNHEYVWTYGEPWSMKNGRTAIVLFMSCPTNSLWFSEVADLYDNGVVFKHLNNGNWGVSIYNTNDNDVFDCGVYMKDNYNGGGHKGAAGCQLSEEQFIEILKKKIF